MKTNHKMREDIFEKITKKNIVSIPCKVLESGQ